MRRLPRQIGKHRGSKTGDAEQSKPLQPQGRDAICSAVAADVIRGAPQTLAGFAGCFVFRPKRRLCAGHPRSCGPVHECADAFSFNETSPANLHRLQLARAN